MMADDQEQRPDSLLPYDEWTEVALRQVMVRAIAHAGEHGLPGNHHFYITFRTDHPDTVVPARLRAQYPQEMTIVLQHQFWDLAVDEVAGAFSVGLSFGGVPTKLYIPLAAVTAFADPQVRYGLRFRTDQAAESPVAVTAEPAPPVPAADAAAPTPQVVSLDAFRRRAPPKE